MAGAAILVPKDKYERLLEISELYHNMKNHHEDLENAKYADKPGSATKNDYESHNNTDSENGSSSNVDYKDNAHDVDSNASVHNVNDTQQHSEAPTKKIRFEPVEINKGPPSIPLEIVKKRLNKLKKVGENRRGSNHAKAKHSKDWLAW